MGTTPGNGLPELNATLAAQEQMNNVSALERRPEAPVQTLTRLEYGWRMEIEAHCQLQKKRIRNTRQDRLADALQATKDGGEKYRRLPAQWGGQAVSKEEFRSFLSQVSGVSESFLRNKVFADRKRPSKQYTDQVFQGLRLSLEEENNRELYRGFGWCPDAVTLSGRKEALQNLFRKKWGSVSWEQVSDYLMLSGSTMDNIRTRMNQHPSTAYHFVIALGDPKDPGQQLGLYHLFQMEPIAFEQDDTLLYGEADGIAKISMEVYDPLFQKMEAENPGLGSSLFWSKLRVMLVYYDNLFSLSLCGQLFYQDNYLILHDVALPEKKEGS